MSDTLPASAHRVNSSGNCSISGCPCRGWSAQETAKEVDECQSDHPWTNCPKCGIGICGEHMTAWLNHQPHQPAARGGGGDNVHVHQFRQIEGQSSTECSCGATPDYYDDEWTLIEGRPAVIADKTGKHLAVVYGQSTAAIAVTEHNQHQSLVAERERLERMLAAVINAHYGLAYRSIGSGDGIPEKEAAEIGRWWLDYTASDA